MKDTAPSSPPTLSAPPSRKSLIKRAFLFYVEGFRGLTPMSRTLWIIILIKLFIMFAILKVFFFPNVVKQQGDRQAQEQFVVKQLTQVNNE